MKNLYELMTDLILSLRDNQRIDGHMDALTPSERHSLDFIAFHKGVAMKSLTEHIHLTKGAITQIVRRLENLELIRVDTDQQDHRSKQLYLTQKGMEKVRHHQEAHQSLNNTLQQSLTHEEYMGLIKGLSIINESLYSQMKEDKNEK